MNICLKHLAQQIIITVNRAQMISLEHYNTCRWGTAQGTQQIMELYINILQIHEMLTTRGYD